LQQDIQMRTNEIQRENRKKDKLERELRQAKADLDTKVGEIRVLQQNLESSTNLASKTANDLKEHKVIICILCVKRHQQTM
jgi:predicted  nucleic acid-binding Zn-ribbon protein